MTIASMTGFAREAGTTGGHAWAWEVKSVNGRGLDVRLRTPPGLDEVGEIARRDVAAALKRGQCQLTLSVTSGPTASRVRLNRAALDGLLAELASLERPPGIGPATLDGILAVRGIFEIDESEAGGCEALRADILAAIPRLTASLTAARAEEGVALLRVVAGQVDAMARLVEAAEAAPGRQPEVIRRRLTEQVDALVGAGGATLDPARLHAEAMILAARSDIREELDRLRAHLDAARTLLEGGGAVGRKLDFLAQELGREANTLCAKAGDVALSRTGLDLKAVVEQFREQVQNVE